MKLIYEKSSSGRPGVQMTSIKISESEEIPSRYLRSVPPELPEVSEAEVVRHFTALSRLNYSIDTHFYPLGSCTMKYNPKACEAAANLPELTEVHPLWPQLWGEGCSHKDRWQFYIEQKECSLRLRGLMNSPCSPWRVHMES